MGKKSNLTHQAIRELNKECHFGQSKYEAKQQAKANGKNPALVSGIYSQATYNSYLKVGRQFIADTIRNHSEVKSLQGCRKYVKEFLEMLSRKLNDALSSRLFYAHFDSHRDISHFKSSCFCELFS